MVSNPKQVIEKILGKTLSNEEWNRDWANNPHIYNLRKAQLMKCTFDAKKDCTGCSDCEEFEKAAGEDGGN